ncbi:MAG: cell division protein ZapB [Magnetococcus sp. DMHC-1]|nr:hypothetical protein [Magnetococcales bacterium]
MDEHSTENPAQNGFWGEHKPQDQQGSGSGNGTQPGGTPPSGETLLAALEQRWEAISQTLRNLRQENVQLREQIQQRDQQLQQRDQQVAGIQVDVERLNRQVADLQQEKNQTIARIETLLTRFQATES